MHMDTKTNKINLTNRYRTKRSKIKSLKKLPLVLLKKMVKLDQNYQEKGCSHISGKSLAMKNSLRNEGKLRMLK